MMKRMFYLALFALFASTAADASAQEREITGRVVDAQRNAPLSGVNVFVPGSDIGTITNANGNFSLRVPAGPVDLRVTLIGYRAQELAVAAGVNQVTVEMEQDVLNLEGVVVTGQATTVQRRNLANAVATVTSEEIERAPPAQTVDKMLQGKIAGANIQTNSGAPGGGVQVTLRGVSSITGSAEPLYVVDGVIMSNVAIASGVNAVTKASGGSNASNQDAPVNRIADLIPADIESIEILKGASAAAIYGSKASNGVILITTKRGRSGAPRISMTQRFGQYQLSNKLGMRDWTRDEAVAAFGEGVLPFFNANGSPQQVFDHEELLAGQEDLSTETLLSISGGTDDTRYYVSGSWLDEAGILTNTGFEKQGVRLNVDQRLGNRVDAGLNASVTHSVARRGLSNNDNSGTSPFMVFPFTPNFVDLRQNADGTFPANPFERSNPLQTLALLTNDEDVWRAAASGSITADVWSNSTHSLRLLGVGGLDFFQQQNELFFPPELQFEPNDDGLPGTSLLGNSNNLNLNANINAVHTLSPASGLFTATTSAGLQYEDRDLEVARIVSRGFVGGQRNVDAGAAIELFETRQRVLDLGVYLQEEVLTLDDRLMLTGSIRADRSSSNGDPDEMFFYPKASASYRFEQLAPWLNGLKLRAAYGETGNQPLFGQKFTPLQGTQNLNGLPGLVVLGVAGDPDIQPERTREIETGIDATLFGDRATLELTYYTQNISNLLLRRTLAPSTGFVQQVFNGGELSNWGIEAALAATPISTRDFSWLTRTTFYSNESKIEDLPVPPFQTGGFGTALGAFRIEEGKSATQIVANVVENGSVVVRQVGDATPDFLMGFTNELTWRNFNVYSLFHWQSGGTAINLTKLLYDFGQNTWDFSDNPQPAFNPVTGDPVLDSNGNQVTWTEGERRLNGFGAETRPYIEDASFVKLREVTIGYDLPQQLTQRFLGGDVQRAQISLSGRNLWTITDYTGLDPEVSNFGNQPIARNIDVAPFPPSRSFWLSFNVVF